MDLLKNVSIALDDLILTPNSELYVDVETYYNKRRSLNENIANDESKKYKDYKNDR